MILNTLNDMIYLIFILISVFFYIKMKNSNSNFFYQDKKVLDIKRQLMMQVLADKGYSSSERRIFNMAFKFFMDNPERFDGATIVGDNYTIEGLSATAMKHDYNCIFLDRKSLKKYVQCRLIVDKFYRDDLIRVKRKYWINKLTSNVMFVFLIATAPLYFYMTGGTKINDR